ncbi:MAG: arylsulfatase A-like enzyme [Planctomycetota bacterium]|jgi:arylsulfatase A-like enzyme
MTDSSLRLRFKTLPSALAMGGLCGVLLSLIRLSSILVMERSIRSEAERELLQWQVFGAFGEELLGMVLLGALAGFWIWAWLGRTRASWLIGTLGAAGLLAYLTFEDLGGENSQALLTLAGSATDGPGTFGMMALPLLSALILTGLVAVSARREPTIPFGRSISVVSIGLVIVGLRSGVGAVLNSESPVMQTIEITRELILEEREWKVRYHHPDGAPTAGIITPTADHRADGGELPAIIMPPPCEIQFTVREEDGPVRLRVVAGADASIDSGDMLKRREALLGQEGFRFVFEVARNGKTVFQTSTLDYREYQKGKYKEHRTWLRPDEEDDLNFEPGDRITVRVGVRGIEASKLIQLAPYQVGFGEMTLEKVVRRDRQLAREDAPSIVLIVQDTMRADRSSTYGYDRQTTPALSALAERGLSYVNAHSSSSWTWPSTASILTGLLPEAHGVTDDSTCYLVGHNETIAEALQARGYTTGAFACNPLVSVRKNFSQGFEHFRETERKFIKTDQVMEEVKSWLLANRGTRFFLYLHLVDPHLPYAPHAEHEERFATSKPADFPDIQEVHHEYKGIALRGGALDEEGNPRPAIFPEGHIEYLSGMYDACVATGDAYLGELVDYLYELGLSDDTLVAFTSDHGEAWLEHGGLTHGQSIHNELVRVPLVIAGPGIPENQICETPVSNRHLAATLAGFGGTEMSSVPDPIDLSNPTTIEARPVFFATTHGTWNYRGGRQPLYGVRDGRWVLHYAPLGSDYGVELEDAPVGGQYRLYDVLEDPLETRDLSAENRELAERLKTLVLDNLANQIEQKGGRISIGGGSATTELLDAIGYNVGKIVEEDEE